MKGQLRACQRTTLVHCLGYKNSLGLVQWGDGLGGISSEPQVTIMPASKAHRLEPLRNKPAGQLLIHEIYRSVQGESTFAGLPCVFVRLAVCDARCVWCDTPHAFNQGRLLTPAEILDKVQSHRCPLVEITGGEPLLQEEMFALMTELADRGMT